MTPTPDVAQQPTLQEIQDGSSFISPSKKPSSGPGTRWSAFVASYKEKRRRFPYLEPAGVASDAYGVEAVSSADLVDCVGEIVANRSRRQAELIRDLLG